MTAHRRRSELGPGGLLQKAVFYYSEPAYGAQCLSTGNASQGDVDKNGASGEKSNLRNNNGASQCPLNEGRKEGQMCLGYVVRKAY